MNTKFKALIFDLGGVLLDWTPRSITAVSPGQLKLLMNSETWYDLDRGKVTLDEACELFGDMLGVDSLTVKTSLDQAQKSLKVNKQLAQIAQELKDLNPDLKIFIMSNISKEHFEIVQRLDLPWSIFTSTFASGHVGMRKPDLCFFEHVLENIGTHPGEVVMIDDEPDNICAARSLGVHGILRDKVSGDLGKTLRNIFQDPFARAQSYMKNNSGNHHCVMEGHDAPLKDNFAQLLIWELTGDADLVYLKWPSGKLHGPQTNNDQRSLDASARGKVENGLWNYFYDEPVQTTREFPPDADTTSTAYLCLPSSRLDEVASADLVMDKMAANTNPDGIMQTYFADDRRRTSPEVCCNILRVFHRFGRGDDPRIRRTQDWVVRCLQNRAYVHGSRFYSTPETFLYFTARLYLECAAESPLKVELEAIKEALLERVNVPTNPLALALRILACQFVGIDASFWRQDLATFMSLQDEDGGWPAGHFCCMGRTGAKIGNRGLTTALAVKIMGMSGRRN